jgi:hypothetical protein
VVDLANAIKANDPTVPPPQLTVSQSPTPMSMPMPSP